MLALNKYSNGILAAQAFWGLWLFPFGYLSFKSGFLPKTLGIFLMVGSAGYFGEFLLKTLMVNYYEMQLANFITIPASIGEIGSALWLTIVGAKENIKY